MIKSPYRILTYFLLLLLVAIGTGWLIDDIAWMLTVTLLCWSSYHLVMLVLTLRWMSSKKADPPDLPGIWGDLVYTFYRKQKSHRDREAALTSIINRYQQSSAALKDAVVIVNTQDRLEWWNSAAEELLGLKPLIDRSKSILNLLRDPRFIRYYKRRQYQEPLELTSPISDQITLQYSITLFGEGDRLLVARDISRMKQLEQVRQSFVSNASHELRTPLTVMRGYLETFLDQELPKPIMRGLQQMEQQTHRMEGLVRDMLMLSRLESTRHVTDEYPVDIHQLLKDIKRDALILSGDKGHQIELTLDLVHDLVGQDNELHSAFSNLVFNAVRYTPAGTRIIIRWQVTNSEGIVSVEDNGQGIESHHIPRLTERFYRIDESRSTESGGTGLGLSIVKHVVIRHGGQLKIHSRVGQGSSFTCHFPKDHVIRLENHPSPPHND
ncbi:MAG: phosphate regulon sensor histidine kinase PhoR [Oceanospirillales bacterium]|nr:MAG: phosphate regulon sensor histidine kinase PhoR [Oceanospirillales bacterium]